MHCTTRQCVHKVRDVCVCMSCVPRHEVMCVCVLKRMLNALVYGIRYNICICKLRVRFVRSVEWVIYCTEKKTKKKKLKQQL